MPHSVDHRQLSFAERRAAIAARHPHWRPRTIGAFFQDAARLHPARPLVITDDCEITYSMAARSAERIARGLSRLGVRRGDRVALVMASHPEFVPLILGIWQLGATAIPVNYFFRAHELGYIIRQSECSAVISMASFRSLDYVAAFDELMPRWRHDDYAPFAALRKIVIFGDAPAGTMSLADLEALGESDGGQPMPDGDASAHDAAIIMYTSGTTGLPKGVIQSHDNLLRSAYASAYQWAYSDGRRVLLSLPLYHAFGLLTGLLSGLYVGGAIIPHLAFDVPHMLRSIERHRATFLLLVPTMCVALLESPELERHDLSSLIGLVAGAAPMPIWVWKELQERLHCPEVFTGYGLTETTSTIVATDLYDPMETLTNTVGRPFDAGVAGNPARDGMITEIKTIDPETQADLAPGTEGEICVRGPTNSSGYFAKPEETSAMSLPDGWMRTGDLGRLREDGFLVLTGRLKELYKSGGEMVSPKEVEEVFSNHPAVVQAFAVGLPDERWGECGCAWIVPSAGSSASVDELRAYARERLARFKVPQHIFFIDENDLPKTPTGKVQKLKLKALGEQRVRAASPPAGRPAAASSRPQSSRKEETS